MGDLGPKCFGLGSEAPPFWTESKKRVLFRVRAYLTCRKNFTFQHPNEFLSIPINGEQLITKNFRPVNQPWCLHMMIKDILTHHGDWKEIDDYNTIQKPAFFELSAIQNTISDYIEEYIWNALGGLSPT